MAGLLDTFIQWASDPNYYDRKERREGAQQFQGLLGSLEQAGPVQPGGLLQSRAPDQQFWLKAAMIPGYENMASQQLGYATAGQNALERDQAGRDWAATNLTLEQQQRLALEQQKAQRDWFVDQSRLGLEGQRTAASVASGYASANSSNASAQNSQWSALVNQQRLADLQNAAATKQGPLLGQLSPQGQVESLYKLQSLNKAVDSAAGVMDYVKNRNPSAAVRGVGTGEGAAMLTDWVMAVMPIAKELTTGPGAVDEGEREFLMNIIKDPSSVMLTDSTINQMQLINQKVQDYRDMNFNALGVPIPQNKGPGATARALGGQASGALRPYKPTPRRNQNSGAPGLLNLGAP